MLLTYHYHRVGPEFSEVMTNCSTFNETIASNVCGDSPTPDLKWNSYMKPFERNAGKMSSSLYHSRNSPLLLYSFLKRYLLDKEMTIIAIFGLLLQNPQFPASESLCNKLIAAYNPFMGANVTRILLLYRYFCDFRATVRISALVQTFTAKTRKATYRVHSYSIINEQVPLL